ncbi:MAG: class I SAM-dependent methyltransferase [Oceanicaulis sp.]|nr:class I SAM-dependent methyltransferase [Oceanicaulis sp.]
MNAYDKVKDLKWFHAIDFGEFASSGRFKPGNPQNITLYGAFELIDSIDITGASVLDIGTYDGIAAFGMTALGASKVVACDTYSNSAFILARSLLGLEDKVKYVPETQIRDLTTRFAAKEFDLVLCAGVIYHMLFPMQAFVRNREIIKDNGYLVMETPFAGDRDDSVLIFNGADPVVNEPYTYFVPTLSALVGMAQLSGFKLIATRVLKAPKRVTLLLQAVDRQELIDAEDTYPMIVQMLKRDTCDDEFRYKNLEAAPKVYSSTSLKKSIAPMREIDMNSEVVSWPYHPPKERPIAGQTRFEAEDGNTLKL